MREHSREIFIERSFVFEDLIRSLSKGIEKSGRERSCLYAASHETFDYAALHSLGVCEVAVDPITAGEFDRCLHRVRECVPAFFVHNKMEGSMRLVPAGKIVEARDTVEAQT